MASKTSSKGKASKVTTNAKADEANIALASELSATLNLEAEIEWFEKAIHELKSGAITAQGLKLTIMKSEEVGQAPSIRSAHAEYFLLADKLRGLEGGADASLKTLLSLAEGSARAFKKKGANDKAEAVASVEVFAVEVAKAKADKAEEKKRGAGTQTADEKKAEALAKVAKVVVPTDEIVKELIIRVRDTKQAVSEVGLINLNKEIVARLEAMRNKKSKVA